VLREGDTLSDCDADIDALSLIEGLRLSETDSEILGDTEALVELLSETEGLKEIDCEALKEGEIELLSDTEGEREVDKLGLIEVLGDKDAEVPPPSV